MGLIIIIIELMLLIKTIKRIKVPTWGKCET